MQPTAVIALVLLVPVAASADDSLAFGYLAARPIARDASGIQNAGSVRWNHRVLDGDLRIELGLGAEVGHYGGAEPLTRVALLPGVAIAKPLGSVVVRVEEIIGWQLVHGKLTVNGIPFAGTETRSFHDEIALAVDGPLTGTLELRARAGIAIDGVYPKGYSLVRVGPFIGVELVVGL